MSLKNRLFNSKKADADSTSNGRASPPEHDDAELGPDSISVIGDSYRSEVIPDSDIGAMLSHAAESEVPPSVTRTARPARRPNARPDDAGVLKDIGKRPSPLPVIAHLPAAKQYRIGASALVIALLASAGCGYYGMTQSHYSQRRAETATKLQMLTQRMASVAQMAIGGHPGAIDNLTSARTELEATIGLLTKGSPTEGVPPLERERYEALQKLDESVVTLLQQANSLTAVAPALTRIGEQAVAAEKQTATMFVAAEQLASLLSTSSNSAFHDAAAQHLRLLAERLRRNSASVLGSPQVQAAQVGELIADYWSFESTYEQLMKGDPSIGAPAITDPFAQKLLTDIHNASKEFGKVIGYIDKNGTEFVASKNGLAKLSKTADDALNEAAKLSKQMSGNANTDKNIMIVAALFLLLAVLAFALLGLVNNRITRIEAWDAARRNQVNQRDIIDFMTELNPLESGDLTGRFTDDIDAMKGITGSIRSTVSTAVASLREAVATVKSTASNVTETVRKSVESSKELQESNNRQAAEIADVVKQVANLTNAIGEVTNYTVRAAEITLAAKEASTEGGRIVAETNQTMLEVRSNMQDVLKSVKHLGETSQEIGQIVETIESITDRTQVLAVNASLEAAKAGAAGLGFKVLAGEVSRLAEQSATGQNSIRALVQRNQGESAAAIKSVEIANNKVVEGARLAEQANIQLMKILDIAEQISNIMATIRTQSGEQSESAGAVNQSMDRLNKLSKDLNVSVLEVVGGVKKIEASMGNLENTVSTFNTDVNGSRS